MAKAAVKQTVTTYDLTLSFEEARTLASILRRVAGCPKESFRAYADQISSALCEVGIRPWVECYSGTITFNNTGLKECSW